MQHWQWVFSVFCTIYCLYAPLYVGIPFLDNACLIFSTALENAQFLPVMCTPQLVNDCFLPAMCTPQQEWFKRARNFWMCASPQVGLCYIQELWLWHGVACVGNKTDKSETIASSHGKNLYNLKCWEWICKVSMGIRRQAMAGVMGFLTFEEIWNDSKTKNIVYILKSSISWKVSSEK